MPLASRIEAVRRRRNLAGNKRARSRPAKTVQLASEMAYLE